MSRRIAETERRLNHLRQTPNVENFEQKERDYIKHITNLIDRKMHIENSELTCEKIILKQKRMLARQKMHWLEEFAFYLV